MSKNLVIVESPAKAKTIEKYLGKDFSVLASMGHLRDLPEKTLGVDIERGFTPKYQAIKGKSELIKTLKKEAELSDKVYLATDPDREGEAISWHIASILGLEDSKMLRITFNEITKNAVTDAVLNPRTIDKDLVDAQQARRVLDRIVGYKLSPLLWKKIRKGLSAGRVQSVATRIVCDREEEIEKFKPEEYWTVNAKLKSSKNKFFTARLEKKDGKKLTLKNEQETKAVLEILKNAKYVINSIKQTKKIRKPAAPFVTSTLQQEASRKLNFTSKKTMSVAQTLYEGINIKGKGLIGLITYMRTDSLRISDEAKKACVSYIMSNFGPQYAPKGYNEYKLKNSNVQDAHEAIRPSDVFLTPAFVKDSLTNDQYKLYKLIWERFVASQMVNALFNSTMVDVSADNLTLKATGSQMIFDGFMKLYIEGTDDESDEENSQILPELTKGEEVELLKLNDKQNFTAPPSRYTEAGLIKIMEEYGIGRPSTYAPTISTILQREYVVKEGKALKPTELGRITTNLMKENFADIVDVSFTAGMEEKLDSIENGNVDWVEIIKEFYGDFEETLNKAQNIEKVKIQDEESDEICEKCGRKMVIKTGRFGKFLACPGFPQCKNAKPITSEVKDVKCPVCEGKILEKKSKKGKKYYGCENNPKCSFMTWDEPTNDKCEVCGNIMVKKRYGRGSKLYCSNQECENSLSKKTKKDAKNENS
ncbi:MAG: type I DNA topoisomerase [Clostridia bacterium]|nr:type I DNA topoisomerase [Oscillospiraceae bacterium]MBR4892397.1 type I DNA topoisomerase [Clostridia bacterium]